MFKIEIQNFALACHPRKFVIFRVDRNDLPHLTISFNNPSKEVDIHLTPPSSKNGNNRESITKILEGDLQGFINSFLKNIRSIVRDNIPQMIQSAQPAWLAKNNYYLIETEDESIERWLKKAAPKFHSRYRLDERELDKIPDHKLFYPTKRHFIELGKQGQIFSICKKGPNRGRLLILAKLPLSNGSFIWAAFDYRDMEKVISKIKKYVHQYFQQFASDKIKRIYTALKLKEIGW
jgi:hypothetical protein